MAGGGFAGCSGASLVFRQRLRHVFPVRAGPAAAEHRGVVAGQGEQVGSVELGVGFGDGEGHAGGGELGVVVGHYLNSTSSQDMENPVPAPAHGGSVQFPSIWVPEIKATCPPLNMPSVFHWRTPVLPRYDKAAFAGLTGEMLTTTLLVLPLLAAGISIRPL